MFVDVHPPSPWIPANRSPQISGSRSKRFTAARRVKRRISFQRPSMLTRPYRVKHSVNVACLGHKLSRHKLQLKDAVSRVNPFIFRRRAAECARVTKWPAELVTSEIARWARMENLMSNSDLIWMRRDGIVAHHETSKPRWVTHKRRPPETGGPTLYYRDREFFHQPYYILVEACLFFSKWKCTTRTFWPPPHTFLLCTCEPSYFPLQS